jgi:hypothetical protein
MQIYMKNLQDQWKKFRRVLIILQWFTFANRIIIVACGWMAHLFEYKIIFPFLTTTSGFIILLIIFWMLCQTSGANQTKRIIELCLIFCVISLSIANLIFFNVLDSTLKSEKQLLLRLQACWGVVCLCEAFIIICYIKVLKSMRKVLSTLWYSIELNYQFVFVIFLTYMVYGVIGGCLFGGKINSETPALFRKFVGTDLTHNLELLNFND